MKVCGKWEKIFCRWDWALRVLDPEKEVMMRSGNTRQGDGLVVLHLRRRLQKLDAVALAGHRGGSDKNEWLCDGQSTLQGLNGTKWCACRVHIFGSNGLRDIVIVLGAVIKPAENEHMFRSALPFVLRYKALALELKEALESVRKDSNEVKSESKKSENVELRLAFSMKNSALHNIHPVKNYHKVMGAKRSGYTSAIVTAA